MKFARKNLKNSVHVPIRDNTSRIRVKLENHGGEAPTTLEPVKCVGYTPNCQHLKIYHHNQYLSPKFRRDQYQHRWMLKIA